MLFLLPALFTYVVRKGKSILIAFSDNDGYSSFDSM